MGKLGKPDFDKRQSEPKTPEWNRNLEINSCITEARYFKTVINCECC